MPPDARHVPRFPARSTRVRRQESAGTLHGSFSATRTTIDGAGRLVVPKPLRAELRIHGPTEVELVAHDGVLEIRPVTADAGIVPTPEGPVAEAVGDLPPLTDDDVRGVVESTRR